MKIVLPDSKTVTKGDLDLSGLKKYGEVITYDLTPEELLPDRVADADVIICNKTPLNAGTLRKAEHLQYIGLFATGFNNIDTDYTDKKKITVCNAGSYSTHAVAQHTFALLLNWASKIQAYDSYVKEGGWIGSDTFSPFSFPMNELEGKTIGIIGLGSIGIEVASLAKAFHMRVLAYNRSTKTVEGVQLVTLAELLARSDVITMHCPLNRDSEKMCNREFFTACKDGAYFINTARGGLVEEEALVEALADGKLAGAAIDVLEQEPMRADCPYLQAVNMTITPHIAWAPIETRNRLIDIVCSNLEAFLAGKPKNVVGKYNS